MNQTTDAILGQPAFGSEVPEHHGDLRKGAYLKRRAAYQMEAQTAGSAQAGSLAGYTAAAQPLLKFR